MNWPAVMKAIILVGFIAAAGVQTAAAEESGIQTVPEDQGFGEYELAENAKFEPLQQGMGRVDRRHELNPLADRSIGWSTGYIAPKGTLQLANTLFLAQRAAYSLGDDFQIFGQASLPVGRNTYLAAGSQFQVAGDDSWALVMGLQARHRRSNLLPGTTDTGVGIHAVFDVIAGNNTTWNAGISGHVPVRQSVDGVDASQCDNRREAAEGGCSLSEPTVSTMPGSGYWVALYGGVNHFATDWLVVNLEAFTGASQGNFWAMDVAYNGSYQAELDLVEETEWSSGLGPLGAFTLGLGTTWMYKRAAIQTSLYIASYGDDVVMLPYVALAINFGAGQ